MLASLLAVVAFAATPCTSRQLLRKVVDGERFVFYPMASGRARWYDVGVTPTLERFFGTVPTLKMPFLNTGQKKRWRPH